MLSDKPYKPTKFESAGIDITASLIISQPCIANSASFASSGRYTTINTTGCSGVPTTGKWSVNTTNGKSYLVLDGESSEVTSYDCNNIVTSASFNGILIKATITKQ